MNFLCCTMRVFLLDNYDSFTFMLKDYIEQCGAVCDVARNDDALPENLLAKYQAMVISPGPCTPAKSGQTLPLIHQYHAQVPILGVCLGHQAIGEYFGAKLVSAHIPMHGKQSEITTSIDPLFSGLPGTFSVTRYHSLLLEEVKIPLETIATSSANEIMAIKHVSLPIRGVQFHPESCQTEYGLTLIKNFLTLATQ
jgi:anthranilate synthase/aminodeoxychorismate synthase-like glutamine amidotransferase